MEQKTTDRIEQEEKFYKAILELEDQNACDEFFRKAFSPAVLEHMIKTYHVQSLQENQRGDAVSETEKETSVWAIQKPAKRLHNNALDLTGQRFGRLVAVEPTDQRKKSSVIWRCQCDCGKETFCEAEDLNGGKVRSCGCLQEDQRKENFKKSIHFVDGTCVEKIARQKEIASNTSGHRGVYSRNNGKWRASITFKGKRYDLGTYETFEEAVEARLEGEKMYLDFLQEYYQAKENE